jgi:hypothetical protein
MWKIFRMCSICGEDISFVCKVNVRCGHHVHHECRLNLVPFTKCSICNRIIINKLDVHLSDQDEFCHKRCETNARRYYPPCPVEGCGMALYKHHVITNKQCQQLIVELEGKTYEERMAIYLSYGFREDELGGGELDEETWKKIQTIISASLQEKETEGQVTVTRETKPKPVITPPKTYEPRALAPGERYKPPNKSRRFQERGVSLKALIPRHLKDRVHVSPQEDFALFSQGPI